MLFCRLCGAANSDGDKVCWKCGKSLVSTTMPPEQIDKENKMVSKWLYRIAVGVVIFTIAVLVAINLVFFAQEILFSDVPWWWKNIF